MTDQELHKKILDRLDSIDSRLTPIWDTYQAWLTLGKWGKSVLYLAGAVLGLVVAWRNIFPHGKP